MNTTVARDPTFLAGALRRSSFAAGLSEDVIQDLAAIVVERHYAPGDMLYLEGEPGDGFFLLLSGRVNFTISGPGRRPRLVGWVEKGEAIGLSAVVANKAHAVSAVAALKVSALFFPTTGVQKVLASHPELWFRVSVLLSAGVQQAYSHRVALRRSGSLQ